MRSVLLVLGLLGLSISVPLAHEWTLERARRQRISEETQILAIRRQLESARASLVELSALKQEAPEQVSRVRRVESTLTTVDTRLDAVGDQIERSLESLRALERKTTILETKTREGAAQEATRAVESVRADFASHLSTAESRLRDELRRMEGPEAAARENRDLDGMRSSMLTPIVQLNGTDTVGSGVVLYSRKDAAGKPATYVVSSYHVVRNILAELRDPGDRTKGIQVNVYPDGAPVSELADVLAFDEESDLVLLQLRGTQILPSVARLLPSPELARVSVFTPIYAVGCPLGNDPIPTFGEVASVRNVVAKRNYWMINAPTYFGNSGGGVFLSRTHELVGIFSKIYTHGAGRPTVIPHMGLATPVDAVVAFLEKNGYGFVAAAPAPHAAEASSKDAKPAGAPR